MRLQIALVPLAKARAAEKFTAASTEKKKKKKKKWPGGGQAR
jgi:hypothetical protein